MKIKLEMDRERAVLLMRACEVMARLGMGQFKELPELFKPFMSWDEKKEIEIFLKEKIFPELACNVYNGIPSHEVNEACQVCWDTYQHLRREVSWFDVGKDWRTDQRDWDKMMGVSFEKPFKVSKLKGDFKTERLEDDDEFYERVTNEDI